MMLSKRARQFWHELLIGSYPVGTDATTVQQSTVVQVFSLIGIVTLLVFGTVNFSAGNGMTGVFELVTAGVLLLNQLNLRQTSHYQLAGSVVLLSMLQMLTVLLITGGLDRTGIYWFFAFPVVAYFIKGKHEGTLWILGQLFVVLICHILARVDYITLSYSTMEVRQLLASLVVLSALMYAYYEYIHGREQALLISREQALLKKNQALKEELEKQQQGQQHQRALIETIDKTITKVQTNNAELENAKLAMLNVLEDLEVERRRIEENEHKDEAILASIGEGMIATDANNKIIVANRRAEELLGYSQKELIGAEYAERVVLVTGENSVVSAKDRPLNQALKSGKAVGSSEYQCQQKDKSVFPVSITASPIEIGGKQIGGIIVFRDITKEKQIDKAKTEFVSLASHQLRTPLSAIGWYVEMLLSGDAGKMTKEQLDYLKEIQHGSKRLVDMVNSLLNVSRIELGTFMVEPKPTKPAEIAKDVLGEVKALIEQKQLKLITKFASDIPVMKLDAHLLEIVLQNLVSNAVKYTPAKGTIKVSLSFVKEALNIQVADTGIGIPKDQQSRIFEKLFRADNVRATDTDGTGLGLYMVKQILEEIGGSVVIESQLNKGTTVMVILPASGMKARKGTRRLG